MNQAVHVIALHFADVSVQTGNDPGGDGALEVQAQGIADGHGGLADINAVAVPHGKRRESLLRDLYQTQVQGLVGPNHLAFGFRLVV